MTVELSFGCEHECEYVCIVIVCVHRIKKEFYSEYMTVKIATI